MSLKIANTVLSYIIHTCQKLTIQIQNNATEIFGCVFTEQWWTHINALPSEQMRSNTTNKGSMQSIMQNVLYFEIHSYTLYFIFSAGFLVRRTFKVLFDLRECTLYFQLGFVCLSVHILLHQFKPVFFLSLCGVYHAIVHLCALRRWVFGCILIILLVRTNWQCDAVKHGHESQLCNQE